MRNDDILKSFLNDISIQEKYGFKAADYPDITSAMQSKIPIVRAIAIIIDKSDNQNSLYNEIINYLNKEL